jgi:hypothetical protein
VITTGESGFTHTLKDNACLGSSIAKVRRTQTHRVASQPQKF